MKDIKLINEKINEALEEARFEAKACEPPKCKKVIWVARYPMTPEQAAAFGGNAEIVTINVTWRATADVAGDIMENARTWEYLAAEAFVGYDAPVIAGVFPPVAIEAIADADFSHCMAPDVWTPVSRQAPELRESPDAPIPLAHVRWARLGGMA